MCQPLPQIQSILQQVSTDSLLKIVSEISGATPVIINGQQDTIRTRQFNQPGNEKAFQYLKARLLSYGLTVDSQTFRASGKNLFGILAGQDTTKLILIGAHYDNVGILVAQGADDNAGGVAAVLECARICQQNNIGYTVVFAFWDEEELGSIGSNAYVQNGPHLAGKQLLGYLNLDMIGWDGNNDSIAEIHTQYSGQSINWAAKANSLNSDYNIGLQLQTVNPGITATDIGPFWAAGQTAVGFVEDFDGDRYPYRHTPNDTVGNLNFPYLAKQTRLALATLLTFALISPTAVRENLPETRLFVASPNPFDKELVIAFPEGHLHPVSILIRDNVGRVLHQSTVKENGAPVRIDTREWNNGIYFLNIISAEETAGVYRMLCLHP